MRRRLARLVLALPLLGGWATWASLPAGAHALLAASTPADGETLERPPTEVRLTFTEAPDPSLAVVRVLDAAGTRLDAGKAEAEVGQPRQLRVPVAALPRGTYTVTWRTTSAVDGHTTVGSVAFGVGVAAAAAATDGAPSGVRSPSPTSIAGRWMFYVGVALMLGAGVVGVLVVSNPSALSVWALNAAWAGAALGLVLGIADQRAAAHTSLGRLLGSSTGQKLTAQAAAIGLAWLAVAWASLRPRRWSFGAVGVAASGAMLTRAMAGHADASSVPWFTVGVQWAHLVSVGAWVGGLAWLLIALRRDDSGRRGGLVRRFSKVAAGMLAVVAVSGALRALDEVGAWSRLLHTGFGVTLLVKLGLFAALVALGAVSRFRYACAGKASGGSSRGLRRTVRAEVAVAAAVLGATAVLAGLPPPASLAAASKLDRAPSLTISGSDYATSVRIRLAVTPGRAGPNRFDATVVDYDSGRPAPAQAVTLRFQLIDRPDVAAATASLLRDPDSHWRGSASALSIDGRWSVTAVVQSATDAVEVRMELATNRRPGPSG